MMNAMRLRRINAVAIASAIVKLASATATMGAAYIEWPDRWLVLIYQRID